MSNACLILDDKELEQQPILKKSDMREWLPETLSTTRPFDTGFIKTPFPRVFGNKNYSDEFPPLPRNTSTPTLYVKKNTLSLLEKVKGVLSVPPLDKGERTAEPIELPRLTIPNDAIEPPNPPILYEPKTPPY